MLKIEKEKKEIEKSNKKSVIRKLFRKSTFFIILKKMK